jgi:hypothetical protein
MIELTDNQTNDLLQRFPSFELSYELAHHKKVSTNYDVCLAIPYGRKAFIWFTFYDKQDVCFLMETNRDKKIIKSTIIKSNIPVDLAKGTLFYGCLYEMDETKQIFVIEDLIYAKGIPMIKQTFTEKLGFINDLYSTYQSTFLWMKIPISLPVLWSADTIKETVHEKWSKKIPYTIHHLQYRSLHTIVPHLNVTIMLNVEHTILNQTKSVAVDDFDLKLLFIPPNIPFFTYTKPQYKMKCVFECRADLQNDIYHLYAFGYTKQQPESLKTNRTYCGIAYIPNCEISAFMNKLFRNIKENRNLDYIEESDDEDDFQNQRVDKYVNLSKTVYLECIFQPKFRKWIPCQQILPRKGQNVQLVPIMKL